MGKQFSDSPRAIYEELRSRSLDLRGDLGRTPRPRPVSRRMPGWSAAVLGLSSGPWPAPGSGSTTRASRTTCASGSETTYIQTWHGSAFKRMGFDEARITQATRRPQQQRLQEAIDRFDKFLIRSDARRADPGQGACGCTAELMPVGYPRNDALVTGGKPERAGGAARSRARPQGRPEGGAVRADVPAPARPAARTGWTSRSTWTVRRGFGDRTVLLIRPHYLELVACRPTLPGRASRDGVHDVTPLLLISRRLDHRLLLADVRLRAARPPDGLPRARLRRLRRAEPRLPTSISPSTPRGR